MSGASDAMQGVCVVEKDSNGDVLVAWSFPRLGDDERAVAVARCGLAGGGSGAADDAAAGGDDPSSSSSSSSSSLSSSSPSASSAPSAVHPFVFSRFRSNWMYVYTAPVSQADSKVTAASVVVFSRVFNPAKYKAMLGVLLRAYLAGGASPLPLLKEYLAAFASGRIKSEHGTFDESAWDDRRAYISPVKPLFASFGADTIAIWSAMLLRKRVFVYADTLAELLPAVRSFPLVGAWHRCDWSVVKPYVCVNELELADLVGVYVAGFTDKRCEGLTDRYDLFVNLSARTVSVPEHARASLVMTKFHKDTARALVKAAADQNDQQLIKLIAQKTNQLIANLKTLRVEHDDGGSYVTLDGLQEQGLPPNMDRFLFNVAQAEKLVRSA